MMISYCVECCFFGDSGAGGGAIDLATYQIAHIIDHKHQLDQPGIAAIIDEFALFVLVECVDGCVKKKKTLAGTDRSFDQICAGVIGDAQALLPKGSDIVIRGGEEMHKDV